MRYLADTSFLIDLVNNDPGAITIAREIDLLEERPGLSAISAEEYLRGVYYLYCENESSLREKLMSAENDLSAFEIIPITYDIALKAAEIDAELLRKGEPLSLPDIIIASTALVKNLILLTRNLKHFRRINELRIRVY